jgi:uncharacterized protein DUF4446
MSLDPDVVAIIAVAAAGVAVISLAFGMRATAKLRRVRRLMRSVQSARGANATLEDATDVVGALESLAKRVDDLEIVAGLSVQHVGLVRFDAFEDMGGHLSFAAALLDAEGDGFVFSSINGRHETRIYAKPIERATSRYHLSDEEQEAIRRALAPRFRSS